MTEHKISPPAPYGCAGWYGNKYWVNVPLGTSKEDIERLLRYLLKTYSKMTVVFPGRKLSKPMEITFFVYMNMKTESGDEPADLIYEWDKKEGLREVEYRGVSNE